MADNPMLKAAELLKQLRDQKDDLEERLKEVNAKIEEADTAEIFQRGLNLSTYFIDRCIRMGGEKMFLRFRLGL